MAHGQRIPEDAIDQVLASVSIVDVVSTRGIALKNAGREKKCLCPFHDDTHESLTLYSAEGIGRYKCFSCGASGHAIKFVMDHDGVDFRTAVKDLAQMGGVDVPELHGHSMGELSDERRAELERQREQAKKNREAAEAKAEEERLLCIGLAAGVFESASADPGDGLAARYLQGRGIDTAAAWPAGFCADLRGASGTLDYFYDGDGDEWKSTQGTMMVGRLRDALGRTVGVQRIYLDTSGGAVRKRGGDNPAKMTLGTASGACVRLSEADPRELDRVRLVLTEGIETGVAVMAALYGAPVWAALYGAPVWAALSTSGLRSFELPDALRGELHTVVIAADLDRSGAGLEAARACAQRIYEQSPQTEVKIALPRPDMAPGLFDAQGDPNGKSVDWLDVSLAAGPGVVSDAMDDAPVCRREDGDENAGDDRSGSGAQGGVGGRGVPSGGGGGGDDRWEEPERYCFKHNDHLAFARRVLLDCYAPPAGERAGSRWLIAYHDEKWYRRLPGKSMWELDDPNRVLSQVWQQLCEYDVIKWSTPKPLTPTEQAVKAVMAGIRGEVSVYTQNLPCWAPATFDADGEPLWGVSAHVYDDVAGKVDPKAAIATRSGIMDADAWARGEVRIEPMTPLWFSTGVLPHVLPVDRMRNAIDGGACEDGLEGVDLFEEMCPNFMAWLRSIVACLDPDDADRWMACLQEMFGYMLIYDRWLQAVFIMPGPPRSGKSTLQTLLEVVLSESQIATSTLSELEHRWKPLEFRNKTVCTMSDIAVGHRTDAIKCVETMKRVRGGDRMSIEAHGKGFIEVATPPVAFWITTNELPKLPDASGALVATMVCVPTFKSHVGKEDRGLLPRLMAEGAGIMVWSLFGLRRLRKRDAFTKCAAGEAMLEELKSMGSPVFSFVNEECFTGPNQGVASSVLYQIYSEWSKANGHGTKAIGQFGAALKAACPGIDRKRMTQGDQRPWVYMGLRPATIGDESDRIVYKIEEVRDVPPVGQVSMVDEWARDR